MSTTTTPNSREPLPDLGPAIPPSAASQRIVPVSLPRAPSLGRGPERGLLRSTFEDAVVTRLQGALEGVREALAAGQGAVLLCPPDRGFFENMPHGFGVLRNQCWRAMRDLPPQAWVLVTDFPEGIGRKFPGDWDGGYPNVMIGMTVLAGPCPDGHEEYRIGEFRRIPARFRLLWANPAALGRGHLEALHDFDVLVLDDTASFLPSGGPPVPREEIERACLAAGTLIWRLSGISGRRPSPPPGAGAAGWCVPAVPGFGGIPCRSRVP